MDTLSEDEIEDFLWGCKELYQELGDEKRWHRVVFTVVEHPETGDAWGIEWGRGLTECQENEFWEQPYLVEPYEETIPAKTVTKWRKVSNG